MLVDGVDLVSGSTIREVIIREEQRDVAFPPNPSEGDKFVLTEAYNDGQTTYEAGLYEHVSGNWIQPSPEEVLNPYDIAGSVTGQPTAGATLLQFMVVRKFRLSANFAGCIARCGTVGNGSTAFSIYKNADSIGTVTFGAGSNSGAFSATSEVSYYPGDLFKVVAPDPVDAVIADVWFTFAGVLA
jgi:hypothetical protein